MADAETQGANAGEVDRLHEQSHSEHGSHHSGHGAHHHDAHHHDEPMTQEEAVRSLLLLGEVALEASDYDSAREAYASVLKLEGNETAFYNLGSLFARGLGVKRSYIDAARMFHQAEYMGNERAGKLCGKCMFDYVCEDIDSKKPAELYAAMAIFVSQVYPEADDQKDEVSRGLYAIAATYLNKEEYARAAKVFRASAEFGNDGFAQYYVGALYNAGAGVEENALAALYWFDCAVDNGAADVALAERDGALEAFRQSLSPSEFCETMATLSDWCERGTADIPVNPVKAARWRELA